MNKHLLIAVTTDLNTDQRMQKTALSLHQAGYQVHLIGRKRPRSMKLQASPFVQTRINMWFHKGPLFYAEFNFRLWLFALRARADAFTSVDTDTLPALRVAAFMRRKPLIWDAHEIFTGVPELLNRPLVRGVWLIIERLFLPGIQYSYTVSEGVAEWYARRYGLRMQLVYNMPSVQPSTTNLPEKIPIEPFSPRTNNPQTTNPQASNPQASNPQASHKAKNYLLYQGAVNVGRGLPTLLQTMSRHHLPLVIAGGGDILQDLKEEMRQLKLEDRVRFTGLLNPDELRELTRDAYIGFNLLDGDSENYRHSLANRFFDFVQAGVPQIGMNFESYRRFNEQFEVAILLDQADAHNVSAAILRLMNDPILYNHLREQCHQAAKHWSWEADSESILLSVYREAIPS
jgi:glycosyltransferase involved in cell wall biosynthesis